MKISIQKNDAMDLATKSFAEAGLTKMGRYEINDYKKKLSLSTFGESSFSKKNFLKAEHKTPHRVHRQLMMQVDGLIYTLYSNKEKQIQFEIDIQELELKIQELESCQSNREHSPIVDVLKEESKLEESIEGEQLSLEKIEELKEMVLGDSQPLHTRPFNGYDEKKYELLILKLQSKIRDKKFGKAQGSKLIQDAVDNLNTLQDELDKVQPLVDKLEEAGITFEDAENVYWSRRFQENSVIQQFVNNPVLYQQEDNKQKEIFIDKARSLDPEQLKAIFNLPIKSRTITLEKLGLPHNLKEVLGLDEPESDTIENIVDNYKKFI